MHESIFKKTEKSQASQSVLPATSFVERKAGDFHLYLKPNFKFVVTVFLLAILLVKFYYVELLSVPMLSQFDISLLPLPHTFVLCFCLL